ncbi:MAG: FAD-dependent monooxygenase [Candidatus Competibacteraceae bacterium]|nr:FAD-dependent monooxygenase [Candidatus Competibacteraceae bacterium]
MQQEIEISLWPEETGNDSIIKQKILSILQLHDSETIHYTLHKYSIDARSKHVKIRQRYQVWIGENPLPQEQVEPIFQNVSCAEPVHIVGAGPAGLFAALQLIEKGKKPIIIERGKDVKSRRRDIADLTKNHIVHPNSNYCFGEGGAGAYSDGKLYTRSDKRGDVKQVLHLLHFFGADKDILVNAKAHIGTNKLPKVIENIRNFILSAGGEIHFSSRFDNFFIRDQQLIAISVNQQRIETNRLILATGHSARDVYDLLHNNKILMEAKPIAMGVRVEHPQMLIDQLQYHTPNRNPHLPPAYYSLSAQIDGRGVYSFCMCPGGIVAPCATAPGEIVTNGWSPSKRNNPLANSGIVVELTLQDIFEITKRNDAMATLSLQTQIEKNACVGGPNSQIAPAQRMDDFVHNRVSSNLPESSYLPGISSASLSDILPVSITQKLQKAFFVFGQKMKGYYTHEALLIAPETRTSSPVRIPRNIDNFQHISLSGLYPCGEGAGYAGGIVSAAIDGMRSASYSAL